MITESQDPSSELATTAPARHHSLPMHQTDKRSQVAHEWTDITLQVKENLMGFFSPLKTQLTVSSQKLCQGASTNVSKGNTLHLFR